MKKLVLIVLILVLLLCSCSNKGNINNSSNITKEENPSNTLAEEDILTSGVASDIEQGSSQIGTSSKQNTASKSNTSSKKEVSSVKTPSVSTSSKIPSSSSNPSVLNKDPNGIPVMFSPAKNKTPLIPISPENYYALSELKKDGTEAEIKAYKLFAEKVGNYENAVEFDFKISQKEVTRAYKHYLYDYPQHFWLDGQITTYSEGSNVTKVVFDNLMCGGDKKQIKALDDKFKAKIKSILSNLSGSNTAIEKEIYIHNYIIENSTYKEGANAHNAYGITVEGKGVCESYSKSYMVFMREAGVQCLLVDGKLTADMGMGNSHQWNMVLIDGEYYHIDVTADDPIVDSGNEQVLKFNYFNLNDSAIKKDHEIEEDNYKIPKSTATKHNFYEFFNLKFDGLNVDDFAKSLAFAAKNNLAYSHSAYKNHVHDEIAGFLSNNYFSLIAKANSLLGSEKIKADGKINFIIDENHLALSMKISY